MLVLTRRIGEEIVIADNIRVMVAAVDGQRVRLGITAPPSGPVARLELLAECPQVQCCEQPGETGRINGHSARRGT
jgi:carbon storage regulator